ncbi:MAG: response regulator transcription factor [Defluviitaleaceae bacterium]|nr:response regulator transcription factor [Defluviitaleaceae bacterium]
MSAKILLVEDNPQVMKINRKALMMRGYEIVEATTLSEGREVFEREKPDLIVLDIMLPDGNGLSLCEELRGGSDVPILFLTALGEDKEIVEGLKAGGDDYLPKSYSLEVLITRVQALLRRASIVPKVITKGALTIKIPSSEVLVNDESRRLSQNEFSLLLIFAQNENRMMAGADLYEQVWGQPMIDDSSAVKNTVYRLRKELIGSGFTITGERGRGYCFEKS